MANTLRQVLSEEGITGHLCGCPSIYYDNETNTKFTDWNKQAGEVVDHKKDTRNCTDRDFWTCEHCYRLSFKYY